MSNKARVIALYLPQFHPIPENDKYWGKGFTEWTNVAKAKPLFRGHMQPNIPADLGFYDLRLQEVQVEQARMAKEAGIEGFCYWHYWFGNGKEVLEKPFNRVIESGIPDYPFCLGWANHDWSTKTWEKGRTLNKDTMIFKQEYPGVDDYENHFYSYLKAFKDKRYITVDNRLLFIIFEPFSVPDIDVFFSTWKNLAQINNLPGFYFIGVNAVPKINTHNINSLDTEIDKKIDKIISLGFDGVMTTNQKRAELKADGRLHKLLNAFFRKYFPNIFVEKYDYRKIIDNFYTPSDYRENVYPQLLAGWDRSPRSGKKAIVYYNSTPKEFAYAVDKALDVVKNKSKENRIIFLNSWNEWGEGAYVEPDLRYGKGKLEALKEALME